MSLGDDLRAAREALLRDADDASQSLARILGRAEARMLAAARKGGPTAAQKREAARVLSQLNRIAADSRPEVAAWLRGELPTGALNGLRTQAQLLARALGKDTWDQVPIERLKTAFQAFEDAIERREILPLKDAELMQKWGDLWTDRTEATMRDLQAQFVEGIARGSTWTEIAERITDDLGGLNISGQMAPADFARGFARAKFTEIANSASTKSATMAGVTKFINIGVPDEAQSDECAAASAYEPMDLEAWDASGEGPPPRHVLNCRCILAGVPEFAEDEILEEVEA